MSFGAQLQSDGRTRFRLWAPSVAGVQIEFGESPIDRQAMRDMGGGWFEAVLGNRPAGTLYSYVLPDGTRVPDPASRFQPYDVHGPSEVIDPRSYRWKTPEWESRPWHEAVLYEMHVGSFTPEGTFAAAARRLDHLSEIGITGVQVMPIADFSGARNWGYDGALLYAPDSTYGRPDDFKAFVDAAHERGLMVILDVVYNHFGPDGNYLPAYAAPFFSDRHKTPWGPAINLDGPQAQPVREFIIGNALHWITEYRVDGLRLDAVHALIDNSGRHLLSELAQRVRESAERVHLIVENEENEAHRLARHIGGAPSQFTAQWNDDLHHVLHVAATGEGQGYYADYLGDTDKLRRAVAEGFAYQGQYMNFRGSPRGELSALLPPTAFVAFIQNHDQVGNRAFGERLIRLAPEPALRSIAAVYLLLPQIPMLFMGEEWGARQPFPFFCDFPGELGEAVRKGRTEEFARFPEFQDESARTRLPDPQAPGTFESAKLMWTDLSDPAHTAWLELYRRLLRLRRDVVVPLLPHLPAGAGKSTVLGAGAIHVSWQTDAGTELSLTANLSDLPLVYDARDDAGTVFELGDCRNGRLTPWFVRWSLAAVPVARAAGGSPQ
jgi:maltooligosyltrehalose trehalohydrolase